MCVCVCVFVSNCVRMCVCVCVRAHARAFMRVCVPCIHADKCVLTNACGFTHLVELEHTELDLLVLVLLLLGLGVGLLLPLLGTTQQPAQDVERGLVLDARQRQQVGILQLLAVEQHTLLVAHQACSEEGWANLYV